MNNIKEAREKTGLSRQAAADRLGIPVRTLKAWESGTRVPPAYVEKMVVESMLSMIINIDNKGEYHMNEYFKQEKESKKEKLRENWNLAIGLQQVDNLSPSNYLIDVAKENIEGRLTHEQIYALLYEYYDSQKTNDDFTMRQKECDIVSARISDYLSDFAFKLSPETYRGMHGYLFEGIFDFAGMYRQYNISKKEPILSGRTVTYADYRSIKSTLEYDFGEEKAFDYSKCDKKKMLKHIASFTSNIWQVHPFMEGNTRTTALFIECYLKTKGFELNNKFFAENAQYFRNALVRANYANIAQGVYEEQSYLQAFFENLLFQGKHHLRNRDMIVKQFLPNQEEDILER